MATALPIDPLKLIDVGTTANDGTGDQLRTAFEKTNAIAVEGVVVQQAAPASLQGVDGDLAGMITTDGTDVWVCKLDWTGAVDIWVKIDLTQLAANTAAIGVNAGNITTNDGLIAGNTADITTLEGTTVTDGTAAYAITVANANGRIHMTSGSANTVTIPVDDSSIAVGTQLDILQGGTGLTSIAITTDNLNGAGVTIALGGQWSLARLTKVTATSWIVSGDIV